MAKETPFSAVTRTMIDNWLQTSPEDAAKPQTVYNDILGDCGLRPPPTGSISVEPLAQVCCGYRG